MKDNVPESIQLQVKITGVVIPSWLAVVLLILAILASVSALVSWERGYKEQRILEREIRILQVHCQDIENVLIRQGIAGREDFITTKEQDQKKE